MRKVAFSLTVALLGLTLFPIAAAHDHVMVGDTYEFTIGWIDEPAIVDQMNGVWLRVMGPAPSFGSDIAPNGTYEWTFDEEGVVAYHCHPHPWMTGNITVVADTDHAVETHHVRITDGAGQGDYAFTPENLTIEVGDTVHWMNEGSRTHVITADSAMHEEEGDHGHEDAHAAGDMVAVEGVEQTLKVEVGIGGKTRTFDLKAVRGEPGVYTAEFVPTVAGVYSARFFGTVGDVEVDLTRELQRVEALGDHQFPEKTPSAYEVSKTLDEQGAEIDALTADAKATSETPADVAPQTNDVPAAGVALVLAALGVALLARRR